MISWELQIMYIMYLWHTAEEKPSAYDKSYIYWNL